MFGPKRREDACALRKLARNKEQRPACISHEVLWSAMRLRIAFVLLISLQPDGMPCIETARRSIDSLPARRPFASVTIERRCIEPQPCNHGESVTLPRVDGDPSAPAALAVAAKLGRAQR